VAIYVIFVVVVILYFSLSSEKHLNCASSAADRNASSPADSVAYVYKALIVVVALILAIAIFYYGFAISNIL
jgi:flagellar biosynthesis protein FlhB